MNRRDFLKSAGLGVALAATGRVFGEQAEKMDVMADADARIEQCRKGNAVLRLVGPDGEAVNASTPVKIEQVKHKFLFGCNVFKLNDCKTDADNAGYAERFSDLLNFATLPFYWWNYERRRGEPADGHTSELAQWCKANNITTKGHPLAWNYVQPPWMANVEPGEAMKLQLKRIGRCVEKFAGDIDIWDVVNEATHYNRQFCKDKAPVLTDAIKDIGIGEYVRRAFSSARKANPAATLLINDYRMDPAYEKTVIGELVDGGKAMYDVIGLQSHMHGGYWGAKRAWDVCETFAKYNVPLHYTETTVVSGPKSEGRWISTAEGEKAQAEAVPEFYKLLFSHPAVEAITWWDFTDQNAWQGAPAGLVRADMSPKPAYDRLMDLVKGKWWTKTESQVKRNGRVRFNGYFGQYRITATVNGRKVGGDFALDKDAKEPVEIKLS